VKHPTIATASHGALVVLLVALGEPPARAQSTITNTASAEWRLTLVPNGPLLPGGPYTRQAQAATTLVVEADLALAKAVTTPASGPGSEVTFELTATNAGPDAAVDLTVSDPLPVPLTFVSATPSPGGVCAPVPAVGTNGTVTCTWAGPTAASTQRTVTIVAEVPEDVAVASVTNTATTATTTTDPNPANNDASAEAATASADLALAKAVVTPPTGPGSQLAYLLTATNTGPDAAFDLTISDPLPLPLTFVSATPSSGGVCAPVPAVGSNGTVTCTWAGLTPASAQRTVTIVAGVPADSLATYVANLASTSATTPDPVPGNDTASVTVSLAAPNIPALAPAGLAGLVLVLGALALRRLRRARTTDG
jgi:uncharacterized repeat protein (TIGR01451 family)